MLTDLELKEKNYRHSHNVKCHCGKKVEVWINADNKVIYMVAEDHPGILEGHAKCYLGVDSETVQ